MSQRRIAVLLVNVLVFVVFAELVSLTIFYYQTGHLFYAYRKPYPSFPETRDRRLTGDGLHPYFGPTHKSGHPFDVPASLLDAPPQRRAVSSDPATQVDLGRAMRRLSPTLRAVVYLHFFEDRTLNRVAAELSIPESTAKTRLYEALRRLQRALPGYGPSNAGEQT